jgi:hypothetical protein
MPARFLPKPPPRCLICKAEPQERGTGGACAKCHADAAAIAAEWRRGEI